MRLTRRDGERWKTLRALASSERDRQAAGQTVLDGIHVVQAFAASGGIVEQLIVSDSGQSNLEITEYLRTAEADLIEVPDAMFTQLSTVSAPTGIMAVIAIPRAAGPLTGSCVVLDAAQDAGNVGAILRSAAAAGIGHAVIGAGSAHAWSPRVLRAAMGAHFSMSIHDGVHIPSALQAYTSAILTTAADASRSIYEADLTGDVAWLLGNEGSGVSEAVRAIATGSVSIPITDKVESLNVAAAAAVCFFEQRRQRTNRAR